MGVDCSCSIPSQHSVYLDSMEKVEKIIHHPQGRTDVLGTLLKQATGQPQTGYCSSNPF